LQVAGVAAPVSYPADNVATMSQDDITAAALAESLINSEHMAVSQDRSYDLQQQRYLTWFEERLALEDFDYDDFEDNGRKYFRRPYIDLYFQTIIAKWSVKPETARRALSALQKLVNETENLNALVRFVVEDSLLVQNALFSSKRLYETHQKDLSRIADPHANLRTNQLREVDKINFMHNVLINNRLNWKNSCRHFTGCEPMLLRTHSILHMKLSDLNYNNTHAFNQGVDAQGRDAIDAAMLCLVYQKLLHKERNIASWVPGATSFSCSALRAWQLWCSLLISALIRISISTGKTSISPRTGETSHS
jgi:hypothetical protein